MLKPDFAEAHNNLGNALTELGRLDEAEASCRQAIAVKPDFAEAHINLGTTLRELGELEQAEASYNRAIALNASLLEAYTHLGSILIELERLAEAEASFRQAIVLAPDATEAQEYLLKCLYWQCKKPDFLDQLELLTYRGQNNALIGSMARHATLKFGIEAANPFCDAPLNYVQHTQLNDRYDFEAVFVKTSLSLLATDKLSDRSQGLLINGSQTSGNLFRLKNDSIDEMERIIRLEIERYRLNFQGSTEGFLTLWPSEYTLAGWLISMTSGGKLDPHIHERGWLSGSVYINVPPRLEPNDGNFNVVEGEGDDITNTGLDRMDTINVETGSLVLFPSSLTHYTTPFHSDQKRVVLAFDVRKQ
jgi:tetratricopeptide (TPR) repeat protein